MRVQPHAGHDLWSLAGRALGYASSTGTTACRVQGSPWRAARRRSSASRAASPITPPTSRSCISRQLDPARRGRLAAARPSSRHPGGRNQDGVGYPGWAGDETERVNAPIRALLEAADHVLYQSAFCKRSADEWVGRARGGTEVSTTRSTSSASRRPSTRRTAGQCSCSEATRPRHTGSSSHWRRSGARTRRVRRSTARDGGLVVPIEPLVDVLGLAGRVHPLGRSRRGDAPSIFRRAHMLLHTKVNDPCPSVVLEAMASGLPVVTPQSGGVPELVGNEAGIGVPHPDGFEQDSGPSPDALADAVRAALAEHARSRAATCARAVERFALGPWLDRHTERSRRSSRGSPRTRPRIKRRSRGSKRHRANERRERAADRADEHAGDGAAG